MLFSNSIIWTCLGAAEEVDATTALCDSQNRAPMVRRSGLAVIAPLRVHQAQAKDSSHGGSSWTLDEHALRRPILWASSMGVGGRARPN
jgi:hypothetical protein